MEEYMVAKLFVWTEIKVDMVIQEIIVGQMFVSDLYTHIFMVFTDVIDIWRSHAIFYLYCIQYCIQCYKNIMNRVLP